MKKSIPGPIRAPKSPHCTFISEFPGFQVHRNGQSFSNRSIIAPFGKRGLIYDLTPLPPPHARKREFLRRSPLVVRWFRECGQGGGIPGLSLLIPVSPARVPDPRIFLPKPLRLPASFVPGAVPGQAWGSRSGRAPRANVQARGRTGTILSAYRPRARGRFPAMMQ